MHGDCLEDPLQLLHTVFLLFFGGVFLAASETQQRCSYHYILISFKSLLELTTYVDSPGDVLLEPGMTCTSACPCQQCGCPNKRL